MLTIAEIRRLYPDPWADNDPRMTETAATACYCVGGAILKAHNLRLHCNLSWPTDIDLATALQTLRPSLDHAQALYYACGIVCANDSGRFEDAWAIATEALEGNATIRFDDVATCPQCGYSDHPNLFTPPDPAPNTLRCEGDLTCPQCGYSDEEEAFTDETQR